MKRRCPRNMGGPHVEYQSGGTAGRPCIFDVFHVGSGFDPLDGDLESPCELPALVCDEVRSEGTRNLLLGRGIDDGIPTEVDLDVLPAFVHVFPECLEPRHRTVDERVVDIQELGSTIA